MLPKTGSLVERDDYWRICRVFSLGLFPWQPSWNFYNALKLCSAENVCDIFSKQTYSVLYAFLRRRKTVNIKCFESIFKKLF